MNTNYSNEEWNTENSDQEASYAFDEATREINEQLDGEILFVFVGDVNTGKTSTINKLMGEEVATAGPVPGETTKTHSYKYKGSDKILFVDTPGLNDINTENSEITKQYYKNADVILFFTNAAGTVFSEPEQKEFKKVQLINKNIIIVLNKIDAADGVNEQVEYIKGMTGGSFEIVPISSRTGQNINDLRIRILDILEKKSKDILFAKCVKEKASIAQKWIIGAATSAAAIGAAPIPGADIVPITGIQIALLVKLASLYDKPLKKEKAIELIATTVTGNIGKAAFRQIIKVIPGMNIVAGAAVAGAITAALGYAVKYIYENNIELDSSTLAEAYKTFYEKSKGK